MKKCSKCKIEKELSDFNKNKVRKDGLQSYCKGCKKEYKGQWYKANKEKITEYIQDNKEYYKEYSKKWRQANKEKIKERDKQYLEANKEKRKESQRRWQQANKEKLKEYRQANKEKINENRKKTQRNRKRTDPLYKLKCNLRSRTSIAFKNIGYSKDTKTQEMLGVDWEIVKSHIERQFTKGMNWNNQGSWHVDHIIPLASAKDEKELLKLCHYSNLQPLWAEDNLSKKDKIVECQVKLRI